MKHSTVTVSIILALACLRPIAAAADRSPLRVTAEGRLSPFDLEVLSTFAKLHARQLQPVPPGADADVIAGTFSDTVARPAFTVTREVFPSRLVALTRTPQPRIAAIEALRWSRVGVVRGSRAAAAVHDAKISGAELVEYRTAQAAAAALRSAEVASLLLELTDALAEQRTDAQLQMGVSLGTRRSWVYAVPSAQGSLVRELDDYLASLRRTPSWAAMIARHYGPHALETLSSAHLVD
ncbi:MAG TPA: transporter substrate-binding domain-containing protein [Vicinamibacteria bacterium]|nr:transporter substrate-binding domain-containing protein [Vicinamibacteria bacterium]